MAGRPNASAGQFRLNRQKTLELGQCASSESLEAAASAGNLGTPQPKHVPTSPEATAPILQDNQTTPYYEKPPPEHALFTITHSAGWELVVIAALQNYKGSIDEVILVDNFGRLYPFQDVSGKLNCPGPSASDFPIYIMQKELVDTCPETQKESPTSEAVEPRNLEEDFPTEGEGDKLPLNPETKDQPPLNPEKYVPSRLPADDGKSAVAKKEPLIPPEKNDGYADGSYWKKLGFYISFEYFFHVISLSCSLILFPTPVHPSYFISGSGGTSPKWRKVRWKPRQSWWSFGVPHQVAARLRFMSFQCMFLVRKFNQRT